MPSKSKASKKKYLDKMVGIILTFCETGGLYTQIAKQVKVYWLFIVHIIY